MTRDEWDQVLATEPATGAQVGAILTEFDRLGVVDRSERLAISAALLELRDLRSTAGLVMGQAGQLVRMLRKIRDRVGLPALIAAAAVDGDGQGTGGDAGGRVTAAGAITRFLVAFAVSRERWNATIGISRDAESAADGGA